LTDAERETVKRADITDDWKSRPAKLRQKDLDAHRTLKRGRRKRGPDGALMTPIATPVFGYEQKVRQEQADLRQVGDDQQCAEEHEEEGDRRSAYASATSAAQSPLRKSARFLPMLAASSCSVLRR
jgi:hypothetical protein